MAGTAFKARTATASHVASRWYGADSCSIRSRACFSRAVRSGRVLAARTTALESVTANLGSRGTDSSRHSLHTFNSLPSDERDLAVHTIDLSPLSLPPQHPNIHTAESPLPCQHDRCYASLGTRASNEPLRRCRSDRRGLRRWAVCARENIRGATAHGRRSDSKGEVSRPYVGRASVRIIAKHDAVCDDGSDKTRRTAHTPYWHYSPLSATRSLALCRSSRSPNNCSKKDRRG